MTNRNRAVQNYVILVTNLETKEVRVVGTPTGLAITRNGAWIQEREMQENLGEGFRVTATKMEPYEVCNPPTT